jgi:hypothetical protein
MEMTGLDLARAYYEQVVGPLLLGRWPGLPHAAARIGDGSEVLGFDDEMSRDHDWGLRLTLLVDEEHVIPVDRFLASSLPETFLGLPTRFGLTRSAESRHRVDVQSPGSFVEGRLGVDSDKELSAASWLSMTGQALAEVTAGEVFLDSDGELTRIRRTLSWYPHDVWLHVVAADWYRVSEELPLLGRAGYVGDDAGSRILAGRLCGMLMHLGFMIARRWPPYPKWLGRAFAALPVATAALPTMQEALATDGWQARQIAVAQAARTLYAAQRATSAPCIADDPIEPFFDRPFLGVRPAVIGTLRAAVTDAAVRAIPQQFGAIEQIVDNVGVLTVPAARLAVTAALSGKSAQM